MAQIKPKEQEVTNITKSNPLPPPQTSSPSASSPEELTNNELEVEIEEEEIDPDLLNADQDLVLQYRWALWYAAPKSKGKEKTWDTERLKKVVEFGNVKEFWRVFNNLAPPSTLKEGCDLQLFRAGVSPFWEDPFNTKGGTWKYIVSKDDINNKLDTSWFNTVLTMIGDQFDDADDICGLVVSMRNQTNRIGLWVKHADDKDAVRRIGRQFKDINRIRSRIYFYSHEDAKSSNKFHKSSEMFI